MNRKMLILGALALGGWYFFSKSRTSAPAPQPQPQSPGGNPNALPNSPLLPPSMLQPIAQTASLYQPIINSDVLDTIAAAGSSAVDV